MPLHCASPGGVSEMSCIKGSSQIDHGKAQPKSVRAQNSAYSLTKRSASVSPSWRMA